MSDRISMGPLPLAVIGGRREGRITLRAWRPGPRETGCRAARWRRPTRS